MAQAMNVIDYATLAVEDTAVTLVDDASPVLPDSCKRIFITCESGGCRWRADGTAPAVDEGHILAKDDSISFTSANYRSFLENIKFIAAVALTASALKITYFD
jgi:hypothetical protein